MNLKSFLVSASLALATPAFAQGSAPIEPARLAAANRVVAALVPQGIYVRMMRDMVPDMMDSMTQQMMGMKLSDVDPGAKRGTIGEAAHAEDPAFAERMQIMTRVMSAEMAVIFDRMEPGIRSGLGRAFARKFTVAQLDDVNGFFATPSGKAFASEYLLIFADPEVMREMAAAMPEMLRAMPQIMKKVEKATAHLPPFQHPDTDQVPIGESELE